jgi:hypothetical protein
MGFHTLSIVGNYPHTTAGGDRYPHIRYSRSLSTPQPGSIVIHTLGIVDNYPHHSQGRSLSTH